MIKETISNDIDNNNNDDDNKNNNNNDNDDDDNNDNNNNNISWYRSPGPGNTGLMSSEG